MKKWYMAGTAKYVGGEFTDFKTEGPFYVEENLINHPPYYGSADDPYEVIKVIEAWDLDFHLGNVLKYIGRAGKKDTGKLKEDLEKAKWYLERKLSKL